MTQPAEGSAPQPVAWQPLTFGGVAAFASARLGRLLILGVVTTGIFGGAFVWFLSRDYCPIVLQAIQKMPESARVENGKLQGLTNDVISESRLLGIVVTPGNAAEIGQGADVQFEVRQTDFCVNSIFRPDWGMVFDYAPGSYLDLRRSALEPWWGAWHPVLLTIAGVGVAIAIFVSWVLLTIVYLIPVKFAAWFMDRNLSWTGAARLCFAAMAPGTLLMTFAILLYGLQAIDLVKFSVLWAAHLIIGCVYITGGIWAAPRLFPRVTAKNPFVSL